jgi:hypothetical protein
MASSPTLAALEVKHEIAMSLEHHSEALDNVITADIRDEIKTYLQHDGQANFTPENLAAKEHFDASGPSCSNLRDRDVRADSPLKEESDPDLAGQASVAAWIDEKSGATNVALSPTPEVTMILTLQTNIWNC